MGRIGPNPERHILMALLRLRLEMFAAPILKWHNDPFVPPRVQPRSLFLDLVKCHSRPAPIPLAKDPNTHKGDYELAIAPYPTRYFQAMFDMPRDYWTVAPSVNHEVLFDCPVQIIAAPAVPPPPAL
jgi:hypothetical protein